MKKVLLWICVLLTLCLCGCGKKEQATETNASKDLEKSSETNSLDMLLDINENDAKDFEYKVKNDEIHITKYIGESKKVMVPGLIGGRYVVSIGDSAFQGTDVTDVIIGDCVEEIGASAFANCASLKNVLLTRTVKKISDDIFAGCPELLVLAVEGTYSEIWAKTHCVVNDKKVFKIEIYTDGLVAETEASSFEYEAKSGGIILTKYVGYDGNVFVPASIDGLPVVEVGGRCFAESSVLNVVIPKGVKKIGDEAFNYCLSLESVIIPEGVTHIGTNAFNNCPLLRELVLPNSIEEMPEYLVWPMYEQERTRKQGKEVSELLEDYSITIYVVKGTYGETWAKEKSTGVYKIYGFTDDNPTKSYNGTVFLYKVYEDSKSGEKVATNPTEVADKQDKTELTPTKVPRQKETKEEAFEWEVNEEGGITITKLADTSLVDVVIPERIGGKKVTRIGDMAFYNCSYMQTVDIPESVTEIGSTAFSCCINLRSINIPEGVQKIRISTFSQCWSLEGIELPSSITSIELCAFSDNWRLTNIVIPENVTEIGPQAFERCKKLTSITIPESVQYINEDVFLKCANLREVVTTPNSYAEGWAIENGYDVIYY